MSPRPDSPRGSRPRSARLLAVLLAAALSLGLAGCGGDDKPDAKPDSQPVEGGTRLAALWPLTGEPVDGVTPDHPVLVAKIDNTASSRPQVGLHKADLVTEQLVEGGATRLAAFFYQQLPKVAGPVRSMRASDIAIVMPAFGVLVGSGAAPPTLRRLRSADIPFYEEGGPGYFRDSSRRSPYNLMVNLPKLAKAARKEARVPASYLPWGSESEFTGGQAARTIDAVFSKSHTTSWRYQGGGYRRQNSNAEPDQEFNPDTVLVLRVRQGDAGYLDPAGNPVPETLYTGKGQAFLFHGGKLVRATWSKKARQSALALTTSTGPVTVPAGRVWIELVPNNKAGGQVSFGR